jgi:hypothetical protein
LGLVKILPIADPWNNGKNEPLVQVLGIFHSQWTLAVWGLDLPPVVVPSFKLGWMSSQARIPGHHLYGLGCGWPITQGTVRPFRIIFPPPALYQDLGLLQGVKNLPVEKLITQLPIETLVVAALPWTARFNVERFDSYSA